MPAFLSIFEQAQPSQAHASIEKALSASEGSTSSGKRTLSPKNSLTITSNSNRKNTKKRFVEPPKKTSRIGTLRRLTKKYSKKCKNDNKVYEN